MSVIDSNMISPPVITHISVEQSKAMYSEKCEDDILSFNDIDTALKERSNLPESSEEGPREAPVLEAERLEGVVGDSNDKKKYGSDLSIQNNDNGKRTNRESKTIDSGENPSDKTTCYPHPRLGSQCDLSGDTDLRNTITERSDNTVFCGGEHTIDSDDNMSKSESGEISSSSDLNDTRPSRLDTRHLETSLPLQTALDTPGSNDETTRSKNSEENHTLYNKTSTICSTAENSGKQESFQLIEDNESKIKVMDGSISGLASKSNCLSEMKDIVLDEITKGSSSAVCTTQSNPPHNTVFDDINSTENLYNKTNVSRDNSAGKKRRKSGGKSGSGEQKGSKCRGDNLDFTPFIYEKVESSLGNGLKVKYRRKSNEVIAERTMGSEDDAVKKDTSTVVNKGTNQSLKYSDRTKSGSCGNLSQISNYIVNVNSMKTESKGMKIESKGSVFVSESKSDSIVSRNSEQNSTEPQTTLFDKKLCTEIIVNDNIDTKSTSCNIVPGDVTNEHNIEQKCEELSQGAQSVNIQNSSSSLTEPLVDSNTGGAMSSPSHKMSIPPTSLLSSITSSLHPSPLTTIVPLVVMASSSSSNSSPETIVSTSTSVKTPLLSSTPSSPQFLQSSSPCRAHIVESSIHNAMESADGSITSTASISSSSCDETESDDCLRKTPKVVIRKLPDEIFQRYYYLRHELFPDEVEFSSSKQENRDLEISPGLVFKFKKYSPRSEQYKIRSKPQKPTVKNPTTKRSKSKKSGKAKRKTKKQVTRKGIKLNEEEAHVAKHIDDSALSNVATKSVKITDGENSSLVDPKIMSMSSALLQAFNKETPAESIAFKKRPKIKQSKTPKAFNPSKPASKLQKAYQQARTKKRGLIFEKRGALSNLSANKRPKECKSDVQNKPIRNAGASYCQDNRTNDIDIDQTNTTEEKVFAQSKRPKYKRKMSCPEPRNSRTLSKPSSVSDRNIFENDLFLEAKQMMLVSDEDQGNIFNNGKHNGLRRLKSTSNIARDTDLMFESYSDHLSKSDQAEYDTLSETEHLPKFEGDELEIGQSIIEHAKHWDSQESKSFSTRYSDTKFDMIASEIPQTETPAITSDLPKLSPVATEQEFDPDPRDSSVLPTLYPEGSKQLLSNATDRVKAEQIESPPNFASLWSSNLTSLSIDCAQPLDLSTAASPIGCDDRYRRLPSNVALSMSIPEIKITSPGSSITTFGQLTPVSNPPSCASLSPFLSPSQPPSSHRYRGLNSPSRSGGKRNVNHYAGKPSPLCHYSPNHARASRRDFYQDDSHESDDSDATVVYPKRCKTYSNRTSNTETSSHSVQSGLNTRKVVKQEYDFSNFESKLETCKNELASLVSDIRENVAKHKAMRRSRRTNSFSGENNLPITQPHQKIDNLSSSRPGLERFISVEPVMDSGTPYKSMSRDAGDDNLNFDGERKEQTLLDFVTMLNLQTETTNLQIETGSNGSESEAETKLYDMNFSHLSEDKDADKSKKCYPKTKSKFETDNKSSEGSTGLFSPGSRLEIDVEFNNGDIFSRDEQPHVVIENAESDHVILGKEAMKKMRSGIFQSTERNGKRFPKKRRKRSRLHFPTADFPLDDQSRNDDDVSETSSTSSNNSNHKRVKHTARELQLSLEEEGPRGSKLPSQSKDNNSSEDDRDGKPSKTMPSPGSTGSGNIGGGSREQQMHSAAIRSRSLSPGIAVGTKKPKPRKGRKPKPVAADPIAEHISQSSTARILQELPRFNWLEQKILQQSTNSYKQTTSATNNNNTNNSNNNTNNNINNHNSSSNNNNNNNSSSSSSISPPTQRTISSKSSPHATGSSAGLPSPNNKSTCRLSNTSTPSPSSSSSTSSPSPSSLPAPPLISKRKDSSSSSSKGGDKNQRGGKFNVSSHGSPVDLRSDANSGHLKMTSVATPPPLKLPDDLTRKSPPAMTSEETKSSDADFEANVFPPIKNSCHPNNTTAHNNNNNNRNSDSSSKNEGNSNNLSSDLATTSTTTTTTTITTASSIADDDSTDLPCDTELDLNIPSPENLTIDFGPCSSEHEEEKITDSSKTDGTVSGNTTKDNYDDGQETDVNKDQGNAADDTVIMVFNLKEASQGVSSDREESPRKPNGKQTSIDSNTSSSSASDFTDNEKTEPHQSPPSLAVKSPSHGLNEPVLVKRTTDDGINDGDKIVNVVADSVSIDYTKSPKQPPPLGPVTVTDNNYQENVSDSSQNPIVDDRVVASESVSRSDSPSAVTASSPASPTVLTSSLTTSMTTTTASHSAINTTVPSLVPVSSSPVTDVSSGAPLDLCLNKSDNSVNSIGSGAGRVKANLPVQMVLPQPQTQTGTSTAATTVTSHTPVDVTYTTWSSSIDQSKSADGQSDSEKLAATTSDPLVPNVPKKLKDGGTCYTQLKSLDLSSKLSVTSFAPSDCSSPLNLSDITRFSQDSAQDLTVRVGLVPTPKLNNPSDLSVKRSSDSESQDLVSRVSQNVTQNEALDMATTPVAKGEKKMTDAELEKEFQKHLIEFRALEKLAERKAQEQMQIGMLRKRKAEILRYYDLKRKKRAGDNTSSTTSVSSVQEKRSALKPAVPAQYPMRSVNGSPTTVASQSHSSMPSSLNPPHVYNGSGSPIESSTNLPLVLTTAKNEKNEYSNLSKSATQAEPISDASIVTPEETSNTNQPSSPLALTVVSKSIQILQSNTTVSTASYPTKAHQNRRSEMPSFTSLTPSTTCQISTSVTGPYAKRNTILTEPFSHRRNSTQRDNNFQRAHNQRPFQSPGSLIISDIKSKADAVFNASSDSSVTSPSMSFSPCASTQPTTSKQTKPHSPEITAASPNNPSKHPVPDPIPPQQLPPPPAIYSSQYSPNEPLGFHNVPENYTMNGNDHPLNRSRPLSGPTKPSEAVIADMTRHQSEIIEKRPADPHQNYSQNSSKDPSQIPLTVSSPKEIKRPSTEPRSPPEGPKRFARKPRSRSGSKEHPLEPIPLMMHPAGLPLPVNMPPPAHSSTDAPRDDHSKHHFRNSQMGKMPRLPPPEYSATVAHSDHWQRPPGAFHPSLQVDKSLIHTKEANSEGPIPMSQDEVQSKYREGPKPMRQHPPEVMVMAPNNAAGKAVPSPHSPNNYYWSQSQANARTTGAYIPAPQGGLQHRDGPPHLPPPPLSSASSSLSLSSTTSSSSSPSSSASSTHQQPPALSTHAGTYPSLHSKRQQHLYQQQQQMHHHQKQQYLMQLQHHHHHQQQQQQHPPDQMLQVPHGPPGSYNGQSRLPSPDDRQPVPMYPMGYPPHGQKMRHPPPHPGPTQPPQHQTQPPPPPQQQAPPHPHPPHPHPPHPHPHPQQRHPKQQPPAPPLSQQSSAVAHHPPQISSSSANYQTSIPGPLHPGMPQPNQPPMSGEHPSGPVYMGPPGSAPSMPGASLIRIMAPHKWIALDGSLRQHPSQPPQSTLAPGPHNLQSRSAHPHSPTHPHLSPQQQQQPPPPPPQQQQPPHPPPPPPSHSQHPQQPRMSRHDEPPTMPQQHRGGPGGPSSLHPSMAQAQAHAYNPREAQFPPPGAHGAPSSSSASASATSPSNASNSLCQLCGKMAAFLCSNCRRVWYCNEQCQSKHWSVHAAECKPATADPHYN